MHLRRKTAIVWAKKGRMQMVLYKKVIKGRFLERPNRFIAHVEIAGQVEICHVKNTGRCKELLINGATVYCAAGENPNRKTKFDLIAVQKGERLINMDSQAPNRCAGLWLQNGGLGEIENLRAEQVWGDSRFDFSFQKEEKPCFLEVKGVTLEENGAVRFPDAPTLRGAKHLKGLQKAAAQGFGAYVLFVIQMENVTSFAPNWQTDPDFAAALKEAAANGVTALAVDCAVTPDSMKIRNFVPVYLENQTDSSFSAAKKYK